MLVIYERKIKNDIYKPLHFKWRGLMIEYNNIYISKSVGKLSFVIMLPT